MCEVSENISCSDDKLFKHYSMPEYCGDDTRNIKVDGIIFIQSAAGLN